MADTISSGSLMRPAPTSPHAKRPPAGPTKCTPLLARVATLASVAAAVHMPVFMAGARRMGALVASTVVVSMSSAMPAAILAITLAVVGAMTKISARCARAMCSTSHFSGRAKVSTTTGLRLMVSKVRGVTNSVAFFVIITWTVAPAFTRRETSSTLLYTAMPPVTPRTTSRPLRLMLQPAPLHPQDGRR